MSRLTLMSKPRFQPQAWAKLDRALRRAIEQAGSEEVTLPVVIATTWKAPADARGSRLTELSETERQSELQQRERSFTEAAQSLLEALAAAGARELATYWINGSVAATVPARHLESLALRTDVKEIVLNERRKITTDEGRASWR